MNNTSAVQISRKSKIKERSIRIQSQLPFSKGFTWNYPIIYTCIPVSLTCVDYVEWDKIRIKSFITRPVLSLLLCSSTGCCPRVAGPDV